MNSFKFWKRHFLLGKLTYFWTEKPCFVRENWRCDFWRSEVTFWRLWDCLWKQGSWGRLLLDDLESKLRLIPGWKTISTYFEDPSNTLGTQVPLPPSGIHLLCRSFQTFWWSSPRRDWPRQPTLQAPEWLFPWTKTRTAGLEAISFTLLRIYLDVLTCSLPVMGTQTP